MGSSALGFPVEIVNPHASAIVKSMCYVMQIMIHTNVIIITNNGISAVKWYIAVKNVK